MDGPTSLLSCPSLPSSLFKVALAWMQACTPILTRYVDMGIHSPFPGGCCGLSRPCCPDVASWPSHSFSLLFSTFLPPFLCLPPFCCKYLHCHIPSLPPSFPPSLPPHLPPSLSSPSCAGLAMHHLQDTFSPKKTKPFPKISKVILSQFFKSIFTTQISQWKIFHIPLRRISHYSGIYVPENSVSLIIRSH